MSSLLSRAPAAVQSLLVRTVFALPAPLRRALAGRPIRLDGNDLALDARLLLRLMALADTRLSAGTPAQSRERLRAARGVTSGPAVDRVATGELTAPGPAGPIRCRLYTPDGLADGSPLLVYFHGGGFVVCDLDTHDAACRFLARQAEVRVLSVDYRLAPEHRFPAAVEDALAAFTFAARHAAELGADPRALAVGGDSAGANLAAVTCTEAVRTGGPLPAFQLLFYPGTDPTTRYRSNELFADGFFLTDDDLTWFHDHYCPDVEQRADPRLAVLLTDDLRGLPPAYIATAGFDPLRDEGEAFAERLRDAGVPVVLRRHDDLIHGFVNFLGVGTRFREAMAEAAGALRTGLTLRASTNAGDLFGVLPTRPRTETRLDR